MQLLNHKLIVDSFWKIYIDLFFNIITKLQLRETEKKRYPIYRSIRMSKKLLIIQQLQERIIKINEEIEQLNQDRDLFSSIIRELYKEKSDRSSDSEGEVSELSIEIIPPETKLKPKPVKSEEKKKNTKVQERQEENASNTQNADGTQKKKFLGGNTNLAGKTFELTSSRDCVHQYA